MTDELKVKSINKLLNRIVVPKVNEIIGDTSDHVKLMPIGVHNVDVSAYKDGYNYLRFSIPFTSKQGSLYNVNKSFQYGLCDFIMNTCEYVLTYHPIPYGFILDFSFDGNKDIRLFWYSDRERDSGDQVFFEMSDPEFIFY